MLLVSCNNETSSSNNYTITWKNYDGTILETDNNVEEGTLPTYDGVTPQKPNDDNYTYSFDGWNPEVKVAISDQTYTAKFSSSSKITYTITFVTNGGDAVSSITGAYGDSVKLPSATKSNSFFVGWFTDSTLETKASVTTMPGENITLYAKWIEMYNVFEMNSIQYMYFGSYPQSVVSDSNLTTELDKLATTNSRGYYEYNGNEYAKKKVSAYDSSYTYADGSSIGSDTTKYFKVEPILWRVLSSDSSGNYTLLADQIINAHCYNEYYSSLQNGYYANNYMNSKIRTWLNNDFLTSAFKTAENGAILTTDVDNSASTTNSSSNQYACDNTSDKVYLLSYQDYLNADYGFSTSTLTTSTRTCKPTDYALANYCYQHNGSGSYWTRSPHSFSSGLAWYVSYGGNLDYRNVYSANHGVRPALTINL